MVYYITKSVAIFNAHRLSDACRESKFARMVHRRGYNVDAAYAEVVSPERESSPSSEHELRWQRTMNEGPETRLEQGFARPVAVAGAADEACVHDGWRSDNDEQAAARPQSIDESRIEALDRTGHGDRIVARVG